MELPQTEVRDHIALEKPDKLNPVQSLVSLCQSVTDSLQAYWKFLAIFIACHANKCSNAQADFRLLYKEFTHRVARCHALQQLKLQSLQQRACGRCSIGISYMLRNQHTWSTDHGVGLQAIAGSNKYTDDIYFMSNVYVDQ